MSAVVVDVDGLCAATISNRITERAREIADAEVHLFDLQTVQDADFAELRALREVAAKEGRHD